MPQPPLPLFVECPRCREVLRLKQEFVHPYSARSRCWTDSKGMGWILRDSGDTAGRQDDLYRDDGCGRYFWKSEALHSRKPAMEKAYEGAVRPESNDLQERMMGTKLAARDIGRVADNRGFLEKAIEEGAVNSPGREIWIRLRILWLHNDPLRAAIDPKTDGVQIIRASVRHTPDFRMNADQLLALLDPNNPREMLLMADIFRQLGLFEQATALLKNTAEVFFSTQQEEIEKTRAYNEQFRTPLSEGIADLRPRVESLILLARFIAQRALEHDQLVRPVLKSQGILD